MKRTREREREREREIPIFIEKTRSLRLKVESLYTRFELLFNYQITKAITGR